MIRRFFLLFFAVLGAVFLLVELFQVNKILECSDSNNITFSIFVLLISLLISILIFLIDGFFFLGFLRRSILIKSNAIDTKINLEFGDILSKKGWKVVSVNDCFDNKVDDKVISSNSLHGQMIKRFWPGDTEDWYNQILQTANDKPTENTINRELGKNKRFPIGTVGVARKGDDKFLCVALSRTNPTTHLVEADSYDLHESIRMVLSKAREVANGEKIYIPVMGSGLSRTGVKFNALIHTLLVAIFEESKKQKITNEISIIISKEKKDEINLINLLNDWS